MRHKFKKGSGLHRVNGFTTWCGPYAMTVLTGWSYEKCEEALKEVRGDSGTMLLVGGGMSWGSRSKPIKGTRPSEIRPALWKLGFNMSDKVSTIRPNVDPTRRTTPQALGARFPTFAAWTKTRTPEERKMWLLVNVTGHWVVVKGNKVWDITTKVTGDFLTKFGCRRVRVKGYYQVMVKRPALGAGV